MFALTTCDAGIHSILVHFYLSAQTDVKITGPMSAYLHSLILLLPNTCVILKQH